MDEVLIARMRGEHKVGRPNGFTDGLKLVAMLARRLEAVCIYIKDGILAIYWADDAFRKIYMCPTRRIGHARDSGAEGSR